MIDMLLAGTFLALLGIAILGGTLLSAVSFAGLIAIAAVVVFSVGHPPVALLLLAWIVVTLAGAMIFLRLGARHHGRGGWILPVGLAVGQFALCTTLLWGGLLANDAGASPSLRAASLYPVVMRIGTALPETSDLSYPAPTVSDPQRDSTDPARPIDWAAATLFDGIMARLCCTNRLRAGVPLSPDGFILRPL